MVQLELGRFALWRPFPGHGEASLMTLLTGAIRQSVRRVGSPRKRLGPRMRNRAEPFP